MLHAAAQNGYAIGAFNVNNLEMLQAVVRAAVAERAPVVLQTSQGALDYAGMETLTAMVRAEAEPANVPIALHLDQAPMFPVEQAIDSGRYTSVMVDASLKPFQENIAITRGIVARAHACGMWVEAELGPIPGTEDNVTVAEREAFFTDPALVREFVFKTGCDALAVSIGTRHGMYKFSDRVALDFSRLAAIRQDAGVPLVLHGASAVPADLVAKAKEYGAVIEGARGVSAAQPTKALAHGISQVNIDSDLRCTVSAVDEHMTDTPKISIRAVPRRRPLCRYPSDRRSACSAGRKGGVRKS